MSLRDWLLLPTLLAAVVWPFVAAGAYWSYRRCKPLMPARRVDPTAARPRISVIIPARNEEADVEKTVRSVLAQIGVELELLLVDDHSSDRTGEIIDRLAAEDSRVRAFHRPPSRRGWLGKANAMRYGASFATGDYIVFTDADIEHAPGCFLAALSALRADNLSLLSLLPLFVWESIWESAAAPAGMLALSGFLSRPIHDPESDEAFAVGAFIMVDAHVYRSLGGHAAVRGELLDDVSLARYFKACGERVALHAAPSCLRVRMYVGARAVYDGARKNALALFGEGIWRAIPLALSFVVGGASILVSPLVGAATGDPLLVALGTLCHVEVWLAVLLARPYMRVSLPRLMAFGAGAPVLFAAALTALYQAAIHGSVIWRGRSIHIADWSARDLDR